MNTLEMLTLLLVVFAALTYIDNRNNRKWTEKSYPLLAIGDSYVTCKPSYISFRLG